MTESTNTNELPKDELVIDVADISKIFEIPHEKRNTLKSYFMNPFRKIPKEKFHALNHVSFKVHKGEFVGIMGRNGSGKSTLLKMLAQIFEPTTGKVTIHGILVPFLELGVGFNPELTGRENIFLNGTILGMNKKYLWSKFDEIVDFAEIKEFLDLQVKNYSSGMVMRLAFSIAVQAQADIYLLDEILAVGDAGFQVKSLNKMQELLNSGATVVLVSHNNNDIKKHCKRVILLEHGSVMHDGDVTEGLEKYNSLINPVPINA
jgi:ABC-2 type transport system ATP-binding protein